MAPIILQVAELDHPEESPVDTGAQTKIQYLKKLVGSVISVDPEAFVPVKLPHCINILLNIANTKISKLTTCIITLGNRIITKT